MNGYIAFVKKEFMENIKNYRFFILFAVFLTFGIASAFLAKFTPEILSALAADMEMNSEHIGCVETILQKYLRCWFQCIYYFIWKLSVN